MGRGAASVENQSGTSGLAGGAVGLPAVLFQSITHMAPAAAVAFSITVGVPSAGGLYTYNANGLGPIVGFLVAWGFMLAEPIVART